MRRSNTYCAVLGLANASIRETTVQLSVPYLTDFLPQASAPRQLLYGVRNDGVLAKTRNEHLTPAICAFRRSLRTALLRHLARSTAANASILTFLHSARR